MFKTEEDERIEECVIICTLCINNILIIILKHTHIPIQVHKDVYSRKNTNIGYRILL